MSDQSGTASTEAVSRPTDPIGFVMSASNVEKVMRRIEEKAADAEEVARRNGEAHDGGASLLRAQVEAFRAGWSREDLPEGWMPIAMDVAREEDPEYEEWLRLRRRFGS